MFEKIIDFIEDAFFGIKEWFSPSTPPEDLFAGEMTEKDWEFADEHIEHLFNAIKPKIRSHINTYGTSPTIENIEWFAQDTMNSIRWDGNKFQEFLLFKHIGGRDKYWELIRNRLEPLTTEYIGKYLTETKSREILSSSVEAIVTGQLNELNLDYKIIKQKIRLVLEIKSKNGTPRTYYVHYAKFMKDPRISLYIRDVLEL